MTEGKEDHCEYPVKNSSRWKDNMYNMLQYFQLTSIVLMSSR